MITGTVTSPGVLVLRVRTMYPGDTNIRFIVNTTNTSTGSIISSTHQFNGYEANSIVNISISIPNGGSVSVSIVTINQYGSSDVLNIPQVFTIDPSECIINILMCHYIAVFTTTVSIITTSVTASISVGSVISTATGSIVSTATGSIINTAPTTTPQTVDRSG